ncbi:MAG: fused MFS/spermidine synthase [Gemmatimonadaceae bacterium]
MRRPSILALYALTLFVSASLLFAVQPMVSKMVLPLLGGTPAVWNTCMMFFQAALLAGYAYSYASSRWLGVRRQAWVHAALFALSLAALPIGLGVATQAPPSHTSPVLWLLLVLTVTLGAPFFMLATSAPLLQRWFARSGHSAAANPYFLYSASNAGSIVALLAYPLLAEPRLTVAEQSRVWTVGYWVLAALVAACALHAWRTPARPSGSNPDEARESPGAVTVVWATRVRWTLLAFAPVSLMLGVTSYFTTDIAAVPLLWVIPLAAYLLTFVIAFSRRPVLPHRFMVWVQPFVVTLLAVQVISYVRAAAPVLIGLHLLAFFLTCLVCHGELARTRPPVSHLAEFYLFIALGGVLGGVFNAIVAPLAFDLALEYPVVTVLALMLRPTLSEGDRRSGWLDVAIPVALGLALWGLFHYFGNRPSDYGRIWYLTLLGLLGGVCLAFQRRPVRFGLAIGAVLLVGAIFRDDRGDVLRAERTFFGMYTVRAMPLHDQHVLSHGTTVHGAQSMTSRHRYEPLTYYHRTGPLGQVFASLPDSAVRRVALVGLGTGSIAAYGRAGAHWTYFEVDPEMARIARDSTLFTYLLDSRARIDVVFGDARLTLARAPEREFQLIVLDAFSSDAIPIHLITREALAVYLSRLTADGLLVFHISNRYLDLKPVLAELAADAALVAAVQSDAAPSSDGLLKYGSTWVVMARTPASLQRVAADTVWRPLTTNEDVRVWTDDYSNIVGVLRWKL